MGAYQIFLRTGWAHIRGWAVNRVNTVSFERNVIWSAVFWNQLKIWSSHLLDNLSNCVMNLKNSGDSTEFEPMTTSAMPVQCSNQLSYEVTQLRAGQFVGFMFSRERNVVWKKSYMKCGVLKSNEDMILALAGQFKQLSHEPEKFRWLNGIRTHDLCGAGAVL